MVPNALYTLFPVGKIGIVEVFFGSLYVRPGVHVLSDNLETAAAIPVEYLGGGGGWAVVFTVS